MTAMISSTENNAAMGKRCGELLRMEVELRTVSETKEEVLELATCTSPVWPPRRHAEEAYGWFSQICAADTGSTPLVYETTDGDEVLAFGVCSSPDLTKIMWKDKVCVGLVNTRTAKRSSMRGYQACSSWVWRNRAVVHT